MKLLDDYLTIQEKIYAYFGYEENWKTFCLDDKRLYEWMIVNDQVVFSDALIIEAIKDGHRLCSSEIFKSSSRSKGVYPGKDYTLVLSNTKTDGNLFLSVFDNDLEKTDEALKECWQEYWG